MANSDVPSGFTPVRYKSGAPYNGACNPYAILSTYGTALYVGDPVVRVAAGANTATMSAPGVGSFPPGTLPIIERGAGTDGTYTTGVIVGFAINPNDLSKQYNPVSTARIALVADDPDLVFECQAESDAAVTASMIGNNALYIFTHSGSTVTGRSGAEVDIDGTAPSADASNPLLILRGINRADNDVIAVNAKLEVCFSMHSEGYNGILGI